MTDLLRKGGIKFKLIIKAEEAFRRLITAFYTIPILDTLTTR